MEATPEGILLRPVTHWAVKRGFGLLKRKPGTHPFQEEWAEHKREERELEEKSMAIVLDSHALIAFFRGENTGVPVRDLLHKAATADRPLHMTEVNYAEVKHMLLKEDGAEAWAQAADVLKSLPLEFHPAQRPLADAAADFKARFKISLADAFAAALTKEKKAELVTGDPEFKPLEKEIKIHWLREA